MAADELHTFVVPGQRLGTVHQHTAGTGTYVRGDFIYASLVGLKHTEGDQVGVRMAAGGAQCGHQQSALALGCVVTARVLRVGRQRADVSILLADGVPLREPLPASIRREDVRTAEVDKVQLHLCFRPADVVRARLTSLGTSRSYFLSTAERDLGVIVARGEVSGAVLQAVSAREMRCPRTRATESRKVADWQGVLGERGPGSVR